jgi:hypothetical protein
LECFHAHASFVNVLTSAGSSHASKSKAPSILCSSSLYFKHIAATSDALVTCNKQSRKPSMMTLILRSCQPCTIVALTAVLAFSQLLLGSRHLSRLIMKGVNDFIVSTNVTNASSDETFYSELVNSTVVREIGTGKQKSTFHVILPNGIHAAAKRCHSLKCIKEKALLYEDVLFQNLFLQYGKDAIGYYGMCSFAQDENKRYETMSDLRTGDTLFSRACDTSHGKLD